MELVKTENALISVQEKGDGLDIELGASRVITRLKLVQSNSELITKKKILKPADTGKFFNSLTEQCADSLDVILCQAQRAFVEYPPEGVKDFKGPFPSHAPSSDVVLNAEKIPNSRDLLTPSGNHLRETITLSLLLADTGSEASIDLQKTQIKEGSRLIQMIKSFVAMTETGEKFTPRCYRHIFKMSSKDMSNDAGAWQGVRFDYVGPNDSAFLIEKAEAFRESIKAGAVTVHETPEDSDLMPF